MHSERELIMELQKTLRSRSDLKIGIGDDAALWQSSSSDILITTDMLLDGKHFTVTKDGARRIGHKCLAVNLSDIAAMGGEPCLAFVSLALPQHHLPKDFVRDLYAGMELLAQRFNVAIAGGDTNSWPQGFAISVTVLGRPHARGVCSRAGAQIGDVICVTGPLGGSITGKHLDFMPRVNEAKAILDRVLPHAMLDLSDGLASDLRHITSASKCAAEIGAAQLPLTEAAQKTPDALRSALCDGEDFELCVVFAPQDWAQLQQNPPCPLFPIGRIIAGEGLHLRDISGSVTEIDWSGYQHKF